MLRILSLRHYTILAILGIAIMMNTPVMAQSTSDLQSIIEKQNAIIQKLEQRVQALEQKEYTGTEATPLTLKDIAPKATWAEKTKIKGDFRYRHELINDEHLNRSNTTRNRQRIRARVGVFSEVNECTDFGFQLASGSEDPVSSNQTLDNYFESKDVFIDLAYLDWHPEQIMNLNTKGMHAIAGKMKNPFHTPLENQLIWDGDLRPEGGAVKYKTELGPVTVFANGGGFWLDEISREADVSLWGAQGGIEFKVMDGVKIVGGCSYYDYQGLTENALYADDSFGNSVDDIILASGAVTDGYAVDYNLLEGFWEIHFKALDLPVVVCGDYVTNTATDHDESGMLHGIKINETKKPGDWELSYDYRRLEADAVFGAFTDSDFIGGGTDGKGHRFGVGYQLAKNTKLASSLFVNRPRLDDEYSYYRWQLDLNLKF
ncbi:MAG: hypothetical protein C4541_10445 [Candidatus Auribacter fodinae]|jgi:hypothetical protein|uniref:Porin n=1 Tax=Candidatus Auribacter fodinae TaxID=2093366 RepID=A0A3A4QTI6_9BACT|nr:MAG: hypothetical protein C4541_10445 [Candidatus Auribacter fodinae]